MHRHPAIESGHETRQEVREGHGKDIGLAKSCLAPIPTHQNHMSVTIIQHNSLIIVWGLPRHQL